MKELRELVKKWNTLDEYLHPGEVDFYEYRLGLVEQLEQAIEAQEKLEAEKVALIDKEIEKHKFETTVDSADNFRCGLYSGFLNGLEKAKSILQ